MGYQVKIKREKLVIIMNIIKRIKKLFKNLKQKTEIKSKTDLINFNISQISLLKITNLSKKDQELVKKYQEEINLDNPESLLNYSKNLSKKTSINTNILLDYSFQFQEEVNKLELIEDKEKVKVR